MEPAKMSVTSSASAQASSRTLTFASVAWSCARNQFYMATVPTKLDHFTIEQKYYKSLIQYSFLEQSPRELVGEFETSNRHQTSLDGIEASVLVFATSWGQVLQQLGAWFQFTEKISYFRYITYNKTLCVLLFPGCSFYSSFFGYNVFLKTSE